MTLEGIPPVIVALDYDYPEQSHELLDVLMSEAAGLPADKVGFKIPHWHDQNEGLIGRLRWLDRYVILDTQIVNAANKMPIATRSFLTRKLVLPNAITVAPAMSPSDKAMKTIKTEIIEFADALEVPVIGFAEQTNSDTGYDNAVTHEAVRYLNGRVAGFAGHEVHAANLMSGLFELELIRGSGSTVREYRGEKLADWPDLVVSKFIVPVKENKRSVKPASHPYEDDPREDDQDLPKPVTAELEAMTESEKMVWIEQRVTKIARGSFALDARVKAIYLGSSVTDSASPVEFIHGVLDGIQAYDPECDQDAFRNQLCTA
ncbi:MAG: hypothetical protein M3Q14_00305 [bacterium]|nr:hypothetical protein [bacterium]